MLASNEKKQKVKNSDPRMFQDYIYKKKETKKKKKIKNCCNMLVI